MNGLLMQEPSLAILYCVKCCNCSTRAEDVRRYCDTSSAVAAPAVLYVHLHWDSLRPSTGIDAGVVKIHLEDSFLKGEGIVHDSLIREDQMATADDTLVTEPQSVQDDLDVLEARTDEMIWVKEYEIFVRPVEAEANV